MSTSLEDNPPMASVHMAPKRTYGRPKPPPPPAADLLPGITASSSGPIPYPAPAIAPSPPSSVVDGLSRFKDSEWRKMITPNEEDDEEDEDLIDGAEAYRILKAQQAEKLKENKIEEAPVHVDMEPSSSLPPLTSSSPSRPAKKSTPPPLPSSIPDIIEPSPSQDLETAPPRRSGPSGTNRKKRQLHKLSSDEEDEDLSEKTPTQGFQSSPVSPTVTAMRGDRYSRSPSPFKKQRISDEKQTPKRATLDDSSSPPRVVETFVAESIEAATSPSSSLDAGKRKRGEKGKALVGMDESSDSDGVVRRKEKKKGGDDYDVDMDMGGDMGSASEGDEEYGRGGRKGKKLKAPSKKTRLEAESYQAELRRNKRVDAPMIVAEPLRMMDVVGNFASKQKPRTFNPVHPPNFSFDQGGTPTLDHSRASATPRSTFQRTPTDDIESFSSISRPGAPAAIEIHASSSPSAQKGLKLVPADRIVAVKKEKKVKTVMSDDEEDSEGEGMVVESMESVLAKGSAQMRAKQLAEQKRAILEARKQEGERKKVESESEEDGFEIIGPPPAAKKAPPIAPPANIKSRAERTQAVILKDIKPARSAAARAVLEFAGPGVARKQAVATETMFQHAGKEFGHGDRVKQGPFQAPGQNKNKLDAISGEQLSKDLMRKARMQAVAEQAKRERENGYKKREIPDRVGLDIEALKAAGGLASDDEGNRGDSDDDAEDEDYNPDGGKGDMDVDAPEEMVEEEEEMAYSGEDEGDAPKEEQEGDSESDGGSSEKENQPPLGSIEQMREDKENAPPQPSSQSEDVGFLDRSRRRTGKQRVVVDSDEELEISPPAPLAAPPIPMFSVHNDGDERNALGGGDLSLELDGGFSQFFGATQAFDTEEPAGFDALRHQVIPQADQLRLPEVEISSTALAKNAAVLDAELEIGMPLNDSLVDKPAAVYLNEQGLFTQTKPKSMLGPAVSLGDDLIESSETQAETNDLSATYRTPGGSEDALGHTLENTSSSPTPVDVQPNRRKRLVARRPDPDEDSTTGILAQRSSQPVSEAPVGDNSVEAVHAPPRDAFLTLMDSSRRAEQREANKVQLKEYFAGEAEESEDEYGFGKTREDDDEEDEDKDGEVEGLVDHTEMTEEERKIDEMRLMEKQREIAKLDDAARQAYAQDVVDGKMKGKRRGGGIGVDISDSEEESDAKKNRRRKKQARQQRNLGENDQLAKLDHSHPFRATYDKELQDSDSEESDPEEDMDTPPDAGKAASPAPRTETIDRRRAEQEAVRQMREAETRRAEQQEEQARMFKRSAKPVPIDSDEVIDLDSDDDDSSNFVLARNTDQPPKPKSVASNKFANSKRFATLAADQSAVDSRKAGGISSVHGQQHRKTSGSSTSSSTFKTGGQGKKLDDTRAPKRTSSMLLTKSGGFE